MKKFLMMFTALFIAAFSNDFNNLFITVVLKTACLVLFLISMKLLMEKRKEEYA